MLTSIWDLCYRNDAAGLWLHLQMYRPDKPQDDIVDVLPILNENGVPDLSYPRLYEECLWGEIRQILPAEGPERSWVADNPDILLFDISEQDGYDEKCVLVSRLSDGAFGVYGIEGKSDPEVRYGSILSEERRLSLLSMLKEVRIIDWKNKYGFSDWTIYDGPVWSLVLIRGEKCISSRGPYNLSDDCQRPSHFEELVSACRNLIIPPPERSPKERRAQRKLVRKERR